MRIGMLVSLLALTAGCASHWPELDEDATRTLVAVGYFEHARYLDERPCMMTDEEISSGVVDCFATAPPLQASFVVEQAVFGSLPASRITIAANAARGIDDFPLGRSRPQIVLFSSDGRHTIANAWSDVAFLRSGKRAVPVANEFELRFLPCDATALIQPLDFAPPYPSEPLEGLDEEWVRSVRTLPGMRVEGSRLYIERGLTVDDIAGLLTGHSTSPDDWDLTIAGPCTP
jgi:hypothetical protein